MIIDINISSNILLTNDYGSLPNSLTLSPEKVAHEIFNISNINFPITRKTVANNSLTYPTYRR